MTCQLAEGRRLAWARIRGCPRAASGNRQNARRTWALMAPYVRGRPSSGSVSHDATDRVKPCPCGRASNGESIAESRTLARSDSGQLAPKRFEPHTLQNVLALPSAGRYVLSRSLPLTIRIESVATRALAVPTPPEIFLQVVQ